MKAYLRTVQTFFPGLQDARYRTQRLVQRAVGSVHDPDWRAFARLALGDGVVVDIGANRGRSIESFRVVLPGRRIVAFEPNVRLARLLEREYRSVAEVRIEPVALAAAAGAGRLYLPRYRNYVFDGLASIDRREAMNWLNASNVKGFDPRHLSCVEFEITIRTLDEFALQPAVIKLDTQGAEEQVLRGGLNTLAATRPAILLETATPSIVELLRPFDYRPYVFERGELVAERLDAKNVFFLTREHMRMTT